MIPELKKKKKSEVIASIIIMIIGAALLGYSIYYGTQEVYTLAATSGTERVLYACGTVFKGNIPSYEEYSSHTYEQLICTRMLGRQGLITYLLMGPGIVWLVGGFFSLFTLRPVLPEEVFKLSDKTP